MHIEKITSSGIVAVIRGASAERIIPLAYALKEGGVTNLEITMENPVAVEVIKELKMNLTTRCLLEQELF